MRFSSVGEAGVNFIASSFLAFKNKKEKEGKKQQQKQKKEKPGAQTKLMGVVEVKVFI